MTKYIYYKIIQGNYGSGWEDLACYNTHNTEEMKTLKHDLKEYIIAEPEFRHRVIARRELRKE